MNALFIGAHFVLGSLTPLKMCLPEHGHFPVAQLRRGPPDRRRQPARDPLLRRKNRTKARCHPHFIHQCGWQRVFFARSKRTYFSAQLILNFSKIIIVISRILSLTLVEGKKPRKCCYYSFFRLFYFVKKCVPFSWFWSF